MKTTDADCQFKCVISSVVGNVSLPRLDESVSSYFLLDIYNVVILTFFYQVCGSSVVTIVCFLNMLVAGRSQRGTSTVDRECQG
jgi:hypothetical protein